MYKRPDNRRDHKFLDIRVMMYAFDAVAVRQYNVVWIMITAHYHGYDDTNEPKYRCSLNIVILLLHNSIHILCDMDDNK